MTLNEASPKKLCFVGKTYDEEDKNYYREEVCRDLPVEHQHNGKWYCVLHFPDKNKHETTNFNQVFQSRIENQINEFSYCYFPDYIRLADHKFTSEVSFNHATFFEDVDFRRATFTEGAMFATTVFLSEAWFDESIFHKDAWFVTNKFYGQADFREAIFTEDATWDGSTFADRVDFTKADFQAEAHFYGAVFWGEADFYGITFNKDAVFYDAVFKDESHFSHSIFKEEALFGDAVFYKHAGFGNSKFEKAAHFSQSVFHSHSSFSDSTFNDDVYFRRSTVEEDVTISFYNITFKDTVFFTDCVVKGFVKFEKDGEKINTFSTDASVNFEGTHLKEFGSLTFKSMRLRPHWFVNTDTRSIAFWDVDWENIDGRAKTIRLELLGLDKRGISEKSKRLLIITLRQLAANAEENQRFEEARSFRKMVTKIEQIKKRSFLNILRCFSRIKL